MRAGVGVTQDRGPTRWPLPVQGPQAGLPKFPARPCRLSAGRNRPGASVLGAPWGRHLWVSGHPGSSETADTHARTGQDARTPPRDRFQLVQISPSRCWAWPRSLTISSRLRALPGVLPEARAGESHRDLTPGAAGQVRSSAKAPRELLALGQEACPPSALIGQCSWHSLRPGLWLGYASHLTGLIGQSSNIFTAGAPDWKVSRDPPSYAPDWTILRPRPNASDFSRPLTYWVIRLRNTVH